MQLLFITFLVFDLAVAKTEPNLEKRSELALENASAALDQAREAYNGGDLDKLKIELEEVGQSVDLAYQSLTDTGKDARRNPKFFKRAELKTHELLRRLEGIREAASFQDRALFEKLHERVAQVDENLLKGLMSKKK
jgi:hypothetical protein